MALCDILIDANIQSACEDPFFGGYKNVGWIINKSDIEHWTLKNGIVTNLVLAQGKKAYQVQSIGSQPTPTTQTFVKGNYYNKWNNVVTLALLDHGPSVIDDIIKPMASGAKFVIILEHEKNVLGVADQDEGEVPMLEIFGLTKGLSLQDGASREEYNEELNGGWNLPLEELGAPVPSYFIPKEDIEDILTPAV